MGKMHLLLLCTLAALATVSNGGQGTTYVGSIKASISDNQTEIHIILSKNLRADDQNEVGSNSSTGSSSRHLSCDNDGFGQTTGGNISSISRSNMLNCIVGYAVEQKFDKSIGRVHYNVHMYGRKYYYGDQRDHKIPPGTVECSYDLPNDYDLRYEDQTKVQKLYFEYTVLLVDMGKFAVIWIAVLNLEDESGSKYERKVKSLPAFSPLTS